MEYREQYLTARDGNGLVAIFLRAALLVEPLRAEVILTHGRGEHSGRYGHVAEALAAHGFRLWSYDLRGHGRSSGARGDVPCYGALLADLDMVVNAVSESGLPLFLLGHSLGGQITLNYLLWRPEACRGAVVASPYLRLAFEPERWRLAIASVALWLWPGMIQSTDSAPSRLSRDEAHLASLPEVHLMHHLISARMFSAVNRGAAEALAGAVRIRLPLLLIHGSADPVTSVAASEEFYERLGSDDKKLSIYPGMLHETHNEIGREQVIEEVLAWLEAHLASGTRAG